MDIRIGDKYKLTSDHMNVILQKQTEKDGEFTGNWVNVGFYPNLEVALTRLLDKNILSESDATNIWDLKLLIEGFKEQIIDSIKSNAKLNR